MGEKTVDPVRAGRNHAQGVDGPRPVLKPVLTALVGGNDELIERVAKIYLKAGDKVADVTFGRGVFWKKIDLKYIVLNTSDLVTVENGKYDFRALPYKDNEFDVVVLDPPYMHGSGSVKPSLNKCYQNNSAATTSMSHEKIIDMYVEGALEARRILKKGGLLWVKCQDEIESGRQRWSHVEILALVEAIGFKAIDLFVLVSTAGPLMRRKYQLHARKNHSYLWIFKKL